MKKIRIGSIVLLIISTVIFAVFTLYERSNSDYEPPVISYEDEEIVLGVSAEESELLKGVKAVDKKCGDVSDTLVVERVSDFTEDGTRMIRYAAIDESGNVGRKERVLRYEDYRSPEFHLSGPLRFPTGRNMNILSKITASSSLDGDVSDKIKYTMETVVDLMKPGKYPVEFRVMDSAGKMVYLNTEMEVYDASEQRINVNLNQYIVYLKANSGFDPQAYYAGASQEGQLEIQSSVDMSTPGTYYVDYIVNGDGTMGKSRLIVVVN